jgi:hypothetical protein
MKTGEGFFQSHHVVAPLRHCDQSVVVSQQRRNPKLVLRGLVFPCRRDPIPFAMSLCSAVLLIVGTTNDTQMCGVRNSILMLKYMFSEAADAVIPEEDLLCEVRRFALYKSNYVVAPPTTTTTFLVKENYIAYFVEAAWSPRAARLGIKPAACGKFP